MNTDFLILSIPLVMFLGGLFMIYSLKKYYLQRITDYYSPEDKSKSDFKFEFDVNGLMLANMVFSALVLIALCFYLSASKSNQHLQELEKSALLQYKEQIREDVKTEVLDELKMEQDLKIKKSLMND